MRKQQARLVKDRLVTAMARAKLIDAHLAKRLKISQTTIKRWRDGENSPEGATFIRLCLELGVSPLWLFGADDTDDQREHLVSLLELLVGEPEAKLVRLLGTLTDGDRALIVGAVAGLAESLTHQHEMRPLPGRAKGSGSLVRADVRGAIEAADKIEKDDGDAVSDESPDPDPDQNH